MNNFDLIATPHRFQTPNPPQNFVPCPPRGTKRKTEDAGESEPKRVRSHTAHKVEIFRNRAGNVGIIVDGQKFRKKTYMERFVGCVAMQSE